MACQPDVGLGVDLRDIGIEVDCSLVVSIFIIHSFHYACHVRGENSALAVTDLSPKVGAALAATATEEQIIVELVVCSSACTIKKSRRGALEGNDYCAVGIVGIYMSSEPVSLPTEAR